MARTVLTYADYEALPNDGQHYQILDGELFVTATPNTNHQRTVGNLFATLRAHVRRHALGEVFVSPTTVILADTTVVEPDIVCVGADRLGLISKRGIEGAPTLLIEVLSPSTGAYRPVHEAPALRSVRRAALLDRRCRRANDSDVRAGQSGVPHRYAGCRR